jgi:hypothetical protein
MASKRRLLEERADPLLVFEMMKVLRECLRQGKGRMLPLTAKELYTAFAHAHRLIWLYPVPPNKEGIQKWTISHRSDLDFRLAQTGVEPGSWNGEGELKLIDPDKLERAIDRQIDVAIEKRESEEKKEAMNRLRDSRRHLTEYQRTATTGGLTTVEELVMPDPSSIGGMMARQRTNGRDSTIDHALGIDDGAGLSFGSSSLGHHDYERQYQEQALRCGRNR